MDSKHGHLASSKEPQAFRIRRPSNRESAIYSNSFATQESSPLAKFQFRRERDSFQEPTSWLERGELNSRIFNAHDFLQRSILHRHDRNGAKIPHLPMLDSSVEADAVLALLDTVETTLRAHRDESVGEELTARDKLKRILLGSSKKKEELGSAARKVRANVTTFGAAGKQAVKSLQEGILHLNSHISSLASLVEARDLVALLTDQASELDAVHVSKLLAKASRVLKENPIKEYLAVGELDEAKSEIDSCQRELVESVFDWMREAVDTSNNRTVRDCALAASELGVYDRFVKEYVRHITSTDEETISTECLSGDARNVHQLFKATCNDAISVFRGMISTIADTFTDPSMPLGILIRLITEKKVNSVAMKIFNETKTKVENNPENASKLYEAQDRKKMEAHSRSSGTSASHEGSCYFYLPKLEDSNETQRHELMQKKKYLVLSADVFKELAKFRVDVLKTSRDLDQAVLDTVISALEGPHYLFICRQFRFYLELEKKWIEDQLAVSFIEIAYIEASMQTLAPRKHSDPKMFHQYVRFYNDATAKFKGITSTAIDLIWEAIDRLSDVVIALTQGSMDGFTEKGLETGSSFRMDLITGLSKLDFKISSPDFETMDTLLEMNWDQLKKTTKNGNDGREAGETPVLTKLIADVSSVIHDILRCLLVVYVANAETVLQAAAPLLPICKEDAIREQIWTPTSSPLTAYCMAVENLSQANELMANFLLNLKNTRSTTMESDLCIEPEPSLWPFVSQETRDLLHSELNSGLIELGAEAHQGVKASIRATRLRLSAILAVPEATEGYTSFNEHDRALCDNFEERQEFSSIAKPKPTESFVEVSNFLENHIRFIVKNIKDCNRDFVLTEVGSLTRDVILKCWCRSQRPISLAGAMQMIADSRVILKPFEKHGVLAEILRCLPSLPQLFLETADELWTCIECTALADVDARILVSLLRKRPDSESREITRICQALGANEDILTTGR
ncbi:unnamed protein product [Agarophyton chilense]|eukprot:gb/GEZJ01001093.1/.p1 GENE.gb/GEZJ01001093.1/~~gb/GEZJ01001093.1/.p1  ORF type:complete len:974 (+),score=140.47 gb/GEZJ01001093.1/:451-3372(+)